MEKKLTPPDECSGCGRVTGQLHHHRRFSYEDEWLCRLCYVMVPDQSRHNVAIGLWTIYDMLIDALRPDDEEAS